MTPPSDPLAHDRLVAFLRRHHPLPPPASDSLEDQIMAAITQQPREPQPSRRDHPWATAAIAASLLVACSGWLIWRTSSHEATLATQQVFLVETWYGSAYGDDTVRLSLNPAEPDWMLSVYITLY